MDAKRLEELAAKCDAARMDTEVTVSWDELRDLARCAAAWAKVERRRLSRLDINHVTCTYLFSDAQGNKDYANGLTAIEAVEAAPEVKP
jgi:hypothetical protein